MHDLINRTSQNVTLDDRTHILIFASFSRGDIPPRPISPSLYNHSLLVKFKVLRLPYYRSILGPLNLLGQGPIYIWACVPIVNMLYVSFILLVLLKKKKKKGTILLLPVINQFTVTLCPTFLGPFFDKFAMSSVYYIQIVLHCSTHSKKQLKPWLEVTISAYLDFKSQFQVFFRVCVK